MKKIILVPLAMVLLAFIMPAKKKIKIFLFVYSTIAIKETKSCPETGCVSPFLHFWVSTGTVMR